MGHEQDLDQFCGKRDPILLRVCVLPKAHDEECEDVFCRKIFLPKHNHVSKWKDGIEHQDAIDCYKYGVPVFLSQKQIELLVRKEETKLSDSTNT